MTNENMTTATTGTTEPKKTYRTFEIMQYELNITGTFTPLVRIEETIVPD